MPKVGKTQASFSAPMRSINDNHDEFTPISSRSTPDTTAAQYRPPTLVNQTVVAAQSYDDQVYDHSNPNQVVHINPSQYSNDDQHLSDQQWFSVKVFVRRMIITSLLHIIPLGMLFATRFWAIPLSIFSLVLAIAIYWYFNISKVRRTVVLYGIVHVLNLLAHVSLILYLISSQISRLSPYYYTLFVALVFDCLLIALTLYNAFWLYRSFSISVIRF